MSDNGIPIYDSGDSGLGKDVCGGLIEPNKNDSGLDHHVYYGDGAHFSWDRDRDGNVSNAHETIHK